MFQDTLPTYSLASEAPNYFSVHTCTRRIMYIV